MKKVLFILLITSLALCCKNNTKSTDSRDAYREMESVSSAVEVAPSIFQLIEQQSSFNNLFKLSKQAQLVPEIQNLENVTFFAPTNAAINKLSDEAYADLRLPQNLEKLQAILTYHIVEGTMDSEFLISTIKANNNQPYRLQTLQGGYISLTLENGALVITDENADRSVISKKDIKASNGIMHGIDTILRPVNMKQY
ncbi:fasciclin domain-containing protein [uncultured Winogradskyella sp.]|uniref:fasciclin domain-containing protein n=1 Tax=uncultured Winogradskyella sp. TaxID=395353 RepID=UPI0035125328